MNLNSENIKMLLENFNEPILFSNYINEWNILNWSLNDWESKLNNLKLEFRKNKFLQSKNPLWEQTCTSAQMTMKDFIAFQANENNESWLYFDYKYMSEWFQNYSDILMNISWAKFGFADKTGKDSTIWIGSKGAHTPCHIDTYGCNLIAQIHGRKRWIIFPPEENLKPTRIPYEESSVYSKLNFFCPNLNDFKGLSNARTIILNPGDVLFLPSGWWHYVENLNTAISINMWIPLPVDDRKRIDEAIVQLIVSQLVKELNPAQQSNILNPNSVDVLESDITKSVTLLEKVIDLHKKQESTKKLKIDETLISAQLISSEELLKNITNIKIIPKLSDQDFHKLLMDQTKKYKFIIGENETDSNQEGTIEKIINSICNPEILKLITNKLLKDN